MSETKIKFTADAKKDAEKSIPHERVVIPPEDLFGDIEPVESAEEIKKSLRDKYIIIIGRMRILVGKLDDGYEAVKKISFDYPNYSASQKEILKQRIIKALSTLDE